MLNLQVFHWCSVKCDGHTLVWLYTLQRIVICCILNTMLCCVLLTQHHFLIWPFFYILKDSFCGMLRKLKQYHLHIKRTQEKHLSCISKSPLYNIEKRHSYLEKMLDMPKTITKYQWQHFLEISIPAHRDVGFDTVYSGLKYVLSLSLRPSYFFIAKDRLNGILEE